VQYTECPPQTWILDRCKLPLRQVKNGLRPPTICAYQSGNHSIEVICVTLATLEKQKRAGNDKFHLDYEVVVIGGGFSGIGAGIQLRKAGIHSFAILEKGDDHGGVWYFNTYPGIAVDISSFSYSFSFEQNPNWSRMFAPGKELKEYADHCVEKYELKRHFKFNTSVEITEFDEDNHVWNIILSDGSRIVTRYIFSCTGPLSQPKPPEIEGLGEFAGKLMHPARWDHDYDIENKKIAIIGTGATSVQLVPTIAPEVLTNSSRVTAMTARTSHWAVDTQGSCTHHQRVSSFTPMSQTTPSMTGPSK